MRLFSREDLHCSSATLAQERETLCTRAPLSLLDEGSADQRTILGEIHAL